MIWHFISSVPVIFDTIIKGHMTCLIFSSTATPAFIISSYLHFDPSFCIIPLIYLNREDSPLFQVVNDSSYFFFYCHISYIKLLTLILQYLFHFTYLFGINADFCIFIYCFHNLFHILFFHCNTTSRIRIASCTM